MGNPVFGLHSLVQLIQQPLVLVYYYCLSSQTFGVKGKVLSFGHIIFSDFHQLLKTFHVLFFYLGSSSLKLAIGAEEGRALRFTRGVIAGLVLIVLGITAFYLLIIQPLETVELFPVKETRVTLQVLRNRGMTQYLCKERWKIQRVLRKQFKSSILAQTTTDSLFKWRDCEAQEDISRKLLQGTTVVFSCPVNFTPLFMNSFFIAPPGDDLFREIQVIANFNKLPTQPASVISPTDHWRPIQVTLSLGQNLNDTLDLSKPFPLVPDAHLVGGTSLTFVQRYSNTGIANLVGLQQYSEIRPIASIEAVYQNPSPPIQDKNTSSIKLFRFVKIILQQVTV
ncbi:hypothetical protein NP233_g1858 [Leucocoprinus birnbaumii]|uniref:Uncharacterized protein n=1 Tax=Leucocoprinus birnbaumii TaxID=56174 RepID=A0AAD5YVF3_9AGAR|nr:hypothetical protein NP233_g1858 [Leucocoprinus birnbaumii]